MNITEDNFIVRPMTEDDLQLALSWAEAEGWNPGIDDAHNFYLADPGGFLIGELNGIPISCISVVRYNSNFNFIGFYIVKPEYRKQGFGLKTWQAAFKLISNQPAALEGALPQVDNYTKSGFKSAHSHQRYQGQIKGFISSDVMDLKTIDFVKICAYDHLYFPGDRSNFLAPWINQVHGQGYGILNDDKLAGYGIIRKATEGFRIGPLFAENSTMAEKLFLALADYAQGDNIYIDVPNINKGAVALFESYKMKYIVECIRMYTDNLPNINWDNIFGVTTLELG